MKAEMVIIGEVLASLEKDKIIIVQDYEKAKNLFYQRLQPFIKR